MLALLRHSRQHQSCRPLQLGHAIRQLAALLPNLQAQSSCTAGSSSSRVDPADAPSRGSAAAGSPAQHASQERAASSSISSQQCTAEHSVHSVPASVEELGSSSPQQQQPAATLWPSAIQGSCHHVRWQACGGAQARLSNATGLRLCQLSGTSMQHARGLATVRKPSQAQRQAQRDMQVRLVFEDGRHEVMLRSAAQSLADRQGLEIVQVAGKAEPPVVKLAEPNAQAKAEKKREKEQRKREAEQRRRMSVKEVRLGALIAQGDLERLLGQARAFVDKGFRVKLVVRFGHWQRANGEERLKAVVEEVKQWSHVTAPQANEKMARNTFMVYLTNPPGKPLSAPMPAAQPPQAEAAAAAAA